MNKCITLAYASLTVAVQYLIRSLKLVLATFELLAYFRKKNIRYFDFQGGAKSA